MREAELLAILNAGPIGAEALAALSGSRRRLAQAGIDALIDYLDAVTPDADLEEGADLEGVDEDGDLLDDGEKDLCDHEPSLGAPEVHMLFRWGSGGIVDRQCDQTRWADGDGDDLELGDDNGIADMDGLCEQVQAYDGRLLWSNGGYVA